MHIPFRTRKENRTAGLGDVQVEFDDHGQRYALTTAKGPRVWIDASSGDYSIDLRGAEQVPVR